LAGVSIPEPVTVSASGNGQGDDVPSSNQNGTTSNQNGTGTPAPYVTDRLCPPADAPAARNGNAAKSSAAKPNGEPTPREIPLQNSLNPGSISPGFSLESN
jgi:hypothetical protein